MEISHNFMLHFRLYTSQFIRIKIFSYSRQMNTHWVPSVRVFRFLLENMLSWAHKVKINPLFKSNYSFSQSNIMWILIFLHIHTSTTVSLVLPPPVKQPVGTLSPLRFLKLSSINNHFYWYSQKLSLFRRSDHWGRQGYHLWSTYLNVTLLSLWVPDQLPRALAITSQILAYPLHLVMSSRPKGTKLSPS